MRVHLCTELTAAFWTLEPFGEIGANFSLQLSSRTRFDKINKKKVIPENQCEKHKESSLIQCMDGQMDGLKDRQSILLYGRNEI